MRHWRSRVIVTLYRKDDGPGTVFGESPVARYHSPIEWTDCGDGRPLQWWLMAGTCVGWTWPYGFDKTYQFRAAECRRRIVAQSARQIEVERYGRWNLNVKTSANPSWVTAGVLSFFFYQHAGDVNHAEIPMGAVMWENVPNGPGADWIDERQITIGIMREAPVQLDPMTSWACPGAASGESTGTTGSGSSGAEMEVSPTGTDSQTGEACHEVIRGETNESAGTCCGTTMEEIIACAAKFQ